LQLLPQPPQQQASTTMITITHRQPLNPFPHPHILFFPFSARDFPSPFRAGNGFLSGAS
jgi:hypothetical protein